MYWTSNFYIQFIQGDLWAVLEQNILLQEVSQFLIYKTHKGNILRLYHPTAMNEISLTSFS